MKLVPSWRSVTFSLLLSRRWWWSTLLVMLMMLVMTRLGFWQLERAAQRKARNEYVSTQLAADPVPLSSLGLGSWDLEQLAFRAVTVRGKYDHTQQVILLGQVFRGQPGVNLITPLVLPVSDWAVLVNRGWIPYDATASSQLSQFDEPGLHLVSGRIRLPQPGIVNAGAPQSARLELYRLDIEALEAQMTYKLFPFYLQQQPSERGGDEFPKRIPLEFKLDDGPHLGYAIQWFFFVPLLGGGYLHLLRKSVAIEKVTTT